jgi:hypothetical protein
MANPNYTYLKL